MADVQEFIEKILSDIEKGKGRHHIKGTIEFDLAITKIVNKQGGVDVKVVNAGGGVKSEEISRVTFRIQTRGAIAPNEK